MMKIDIAATCDAATVEGGKLNMLGVFDTVYAVKFPAYHSLFSIAFRVRLEDKEARPDKFQIKIIDEKKKLVTPTIEIEINYPIKKPKKNDPKKGSINIAVKVSNITFEKEGVYNVLLLLKNKVIKKIPFYVFQTCISDNQ